MKRYLFCFSLLLVWALPAYAQEHQIDSLYNILKKKKEDTSKVNTLTILCDKLWRSGKYDSATACAKAEQQLSEKLGYKLGIGRAISHFGEIYGDQADYTRAIEYHLKALAIFREINYKEGQSLSLSNLGVNYDYLGNFAQALEYDQQDLKVDIELGDKKIIASTYCNIGNVYEDQGNYPKALEYQLKALELDKEQGDKNDLAIDYSNIGNIYNEEGNLPKVLEYDFKALAMFQELKNKKGIANSLGNIGIIYRAQSNYPMALDYDLRSLALYTELGDKIGIARNYGNIGNIYTNELDYGKALDYDFKALAIYRETGNKTGIARNVGNIGSIYYAQKFYNKSLEYGLKAVSLFREMGDKEGLARNYGDVGADYVQMKQYPLAKIYLDSALTFSKKIGAKGDIQGGYGGMTIYDSATGNYKAAYQDYKYFVMYRDSLKNEANTKKLVSEQMNYEFEQKQAQEKAEQDKKDAIHSEEVKKQKIVIYSVSGGLFLVLLLAGTIFRSLKQSRKKTQIIVEQKAEVEKKNVLIEQQKALVEEKNKEVLDSITYAKRLQDAILPPLSVIKKHLPESFVMYKPKDIVAGDFYWLEFIPTRGEGDTSGSFSPLVRRRQEGIVLIAAADCTGHGVPGAMVSVVCSNALNRAVKEFKITEPGKILDKVRELVIETFEKSESNVQDGMDISLCSISPLPMGEGQGVRLQWSGANNSLWYVQNGELKTIVADKQPIGKFPGQKPFTTHRLNFRKGDALYLFTDGYPDQFGGPKGKKFKYQQLNDKLKMISEKSMDEQKMILDETLMSWQGTLEQVDDILIIGIRI